MLHSIHRPRLGTALTLLALVALTWGGAAQAQTYTGGIADNFAAPTEPASPSAGLLTWIAANYMYPGTRDYDEGGADRYFGTTFTNLTRNGRICGATLRTQVFNGGLNDSFGLKFVDTTGALLVPAWGRRISTLGVPSLTTGTINLDLAALPGGVNLLPTLNAQGFLDVTVDDDSAVDYVTLTLTPCRTDVFMRDNASDVGAEPGTYGSWGIWSSPDIRVCQMPGCVGNENPEFGQTNSIYVKLNNTGPNAPVGNPGVGTLMLYYTASGGGALWDTDWTFINSKPVTVPAGAVGFEVEVPWSNVPGPGHYCLLARWVSASDPMTFPELIPSNTVSNTIQNNNIAWRNVNVVNLSPLVSTQSFNFRVRNLLLDGTSSAALEVRVPEGPSFLEQGDITLTLEPELWASWGQKGTGFEVISDGVVRITDPSLARLEDLHLPSHAGPMVQVTFSATEEARNAPAQQFTVQVVQYSETEEARGELPEVGGVGYDITVGVTEP
ncbi:hypothetical protein DRW03_02780 [Corallococcus sp. H22C18031201]|uniref:hypothetical protein n=1 Tax=Citreicoccus inhibens TaxID=2849499 RepID=UPI000E76B9D1|nr:hypothetical protein [Citreicoccus inhibens]MBU8895173.1 hypothetical protein [Citreicoccus inhibens]RJS27579.1 hypothetical protein DRW03_02780 [Corallococcus sp. H22C18031201]